MSYDMPPGAAQAWEDHCEDIERSWREAEEIEEAAELASLGLDDLDDSEQTVVRGIA